MTRIKKKNSVKKSQQGNTTATLTLHIQDINGTRELSADVRYVINDRSGVRNYVVHNPEEIRQVFGAPPGMGSSIEKRIAEYLANSTINCEPNPPPNLPKQIRNHNTEHLPTSSSQNPRVDDEYKKSTEKRSDRMRRLKQLVDSSSHKNDEKRRWLKANLAMKRSGSIQ